MIDPIYHSLFHAAGFGVAAVVFFRLFAMPKGSRLDKASGESVDPGVFVDILLLAGSMWCAILFLLTVAQA